MLFVAAVSIFVSVSDAANSLSDGLISFALTALTVCGIEIIARTLCIRCIRRKIHTTKYKIHVKHHYFPRYIIGKERFTLL